MKRRFVISDGSAWAGIIAERYSWGMYGLCFYDKTGKQFPLNEYIVAAFAPGSWMFFRELRDGEDWPEYVEVIHGEGEIESSATSSLDTICNALDYRGPRTVTDAIV